MNRSEAEFSVERTDNGHAVRYALGGLRNVGEKAMEQLVAEREAAGWFTSLDDLFGRLPPAAMNSRQLVALAAAGAFDSLADNRASIAASADLLLGHAISAETSRSTGQGGLFGGDDGEASQALRLVPAEPWSRSELMAQEKEAFGFYFAAHPVSQFRTIAAANGARSHSSLAVADPAGASRLPAVMAALPEAVNRRKTRKGKDFLIVDLSDATGQFTASCFEEAMVEPLLEWARAGRCLLLQMELDRPNPDEPPRFTIRSARPLDEVTSAARMRLSLEVHDVAAVQELAALLPAGPAGQGEVCARLMLADGADAQMLLGRDFMLDSDLVERLVPVPGLANIALTVQRDGARPHLRVVN